MLGVPKKMNTFSKHVIYFQYSFIIFGKSKAWLFLIGGERVTNFEEKNVQTINKILDFDV